MRRRALLAAVAAGTAALAGCGSGGSNAPDGTTDPGTATTTTTTTVDAGIDVPDGSDADLIEKPLAALLLERSDLKSPDRWVAADVQSKNYTRFVRQQDQNHDDATTVASRVFKYDAVAPAKQKYDDLEETANQYVGVNPTSVGLGVEGLGYILSDSASVVFRDANVVAKVSHSSAGFNEATVKDATTFAERMYADWRT
ncbi:MAG: hypothetical protein ABEJ57_06050 [Halobacteriaceae archaeon]